MSAPSPLVTAGFRGTMRASKVSGPGAAETAPDLGQHLCGGAIVAHTTRSIELTGEQVGRFWSKVDRSGDGCWEWQACRTSNGYGHSHTHTGMRYSHRISYTLTCGPIPDGMHVLHRCDNPPCCNPAHLWLGTHDDNQADKVTKGRQAAGESVGTSKLTDHQVAEIRRRYVRGNRWRTCPPGSSAADLAAEFGVTRNQVTRIAAFTSRGAESGGKAALVVTVTEVAP